MYLGISCFYHDSSIAIIDKNGKILFAAQEERFSRKKNDSSFPFLALKAGLNFTKLSLNDFESIVFYEKPFLKFERLIKTYIKNFPYGFYQFLKAIIVWSKEKLFQKSLLIKCLCSIEKVKKKDVAKILLFSNHHLSHAASAFYPSNFEEAAIIVADGVGEEATTSIAFGKKNKIKILKQINFPHSLGLIYSAFTFYLGFKVNSDEYKVMGLAPYGSPVYKDKILKNLITLKDDGSFLINQDYFSYQTGFKMTNKKFDDLFNNIQRYNNKETITQNQMNLASSIQKVVEEIMLKICLHAKEITKSNKLCLAGGVALNCVANGKIIEHKIFDELWIQPASGDAGGSLGAAFLPLMQNSRNLEQNQKYFYDKMENSYLGTLINDNEIINSNKKNELNIVKYSQFQTLCDKVSEDIINSKVIGWCQGRSEFGPRALGHRSIIGDARNEKMQSLINQKIKFRESFRPFAPIVLEEKARDYFDLNCKSPYMLLVKQVNKQKLKNIDLSKTGFEKIKQIRSEIPSVTHVDNSARIQTVNEQNNYFIYCLLKKFYEKTSCPVLINTSFNLSDEPIVNNGQDAINSFLKSNLDILIINNFYITKK